jgi:hypothetical protein
MGNQYSDFLSKEIETSSRDQKFHDCGKKEESVNLVAIN